MGYLIRPAFVALLCLCLIIAPFTGMKRQQTVCINGECFTVPSQFSQPATTVQYSQPVQYSSPAPTIQPASWSQPEPVSSYQMLQTSTPQVIKSLDYEALSFDVSIDGGEPQSLKVDEPFEAKGRRFVIKELKAMQSAQVAQYQPMTFSSQPTITRTIQQGQPIITETTYSSPVYSSGGACNCPQNPSYSSAGYSSAPIMQSTGSGSMIFRGGQTGRVLAFPRLRRAFGALRGL